MPSATPLFAVAAHLPVSSKSCLSPHIADVGSISIAVDAPAGSSWIVHGGRLVPACGRRMAAE